MSDLYVELRTRIPVVTQWVEIGTERLQQAQDATGLSDERLAREIPVSVKTWYRWKKRGAVPADSLDALARVLDIEVRRPGERPLQVAVPTPQDVAAPETFFDRRRAVRSGGAGAFSAFTAFGRTPCDIPRSACDILRRFLRLSPFRMSQRVRLLGEGGDVAEGLSLAGDDEEPGSFELIDCEVDRSSSSSETSAGGDRRLGRPGEPAAIHERREDEPDELGRPAEVAVAESVPPYGGESFAPAHRARSPSSSSGTVRVPTRGAPFGALRRFMACPRRPGASRRPLPARDASRAYRLGGSSGAGRWR